MTAPDESRLLVDPDSAVAQLANRELQNPHQHAEHFQEQFVQYGRDLWTLAMELVSAWTPAAQDLEALRRASDGSGPAALSRATHQLSNAFFKWSRMTVQWEAEDFYGRPASHYSPRLRTCLGLRVAITQVLETLERRAAAIDHRALDLRLRDEMGKLRGELGGRETQEGLIRALVEGSGAANLDAVAESIGSRIDALEPHLMAAKQVHSDVSFIADYVTAVVGRDLTSSQSKLLLEKLIGVVTKEGVKALLHVIVEKLKN